MGLRFHLVLATRGRTAELERFLASLAAQERDGVRLTVVDQNPDERLEPLVARHRTRVSLDRIRSEPGASRARNAGLGGDEEVVAFPDDDCWYPPGLLDRVAAELDAHPEWDGLGGRSLDAAGKPSAARWDARAGDVTRRNAWRRGLNFTLFLRRRVVEAVGPFDEELGVGSRGLYQAGEETDYLIRAVDLGFRIHYDPSLVVHHPEPLASPGGLNPARAEGYGRGMGRVLKKHRFPAPFALYFCARPLAGAVVALASGRPELARFRWHAARGRLAGYRSA